MARYRRRSRVRAPLEAVWSFHDGVEGLVALTPDWMHLRIESTTGPDGAADPDVLETGSTVSLSMRPFGVGPRTRWTSRITERVEGEEVCWFRDEMVEGPFPRWVHTHRFRGDDEATVVTDIVEYTLPVLPAPLAPIGWPGFELLFGHRHRRLATLLSD